MRQTVGPCRLAQAHLLVLGEHRGVQVVPLLFQFRNLAFQRAEPGLLLQRGRNAGPMPAQGLVDVQLLGLAAECLAMVMQTLDARLVFRRPLLDRLQAFDRVGRARWSAGRATIAPRPTPDAAASGRGPPPPGRGVRVAAAALPALLASATARAGAGRGRPPGEHTSGVCDCCSSICRRICSRWCMSCAIWLGPPC